MGCGEATFVNKSTIDFPIFLLFFDTKFPIFPIFSNLTFLFSYFSGQPCRWTPCTFHNFHSNFDISKCLSSTYKQAFSLLHSNIRSSSGNFEDFTTVFTELYCPVLVIGLSGTKINFGEQPLINTDLPRYTFLSQNTLSNAGGVGYH